MNVLALNWADVQVLTFLGGVNPTTASLWLTDIAHHHLAIGVVFLVAGHLYRTQFGIGSRIADLLRAHRLLFINSWHAQLSINLAAIGSLSILFAHHEYSMPDYPYIAYDHATQLSLFTHHMWMGGFFIVGAGAHGASFRGSSIVFLGINTPFWFTSTGPASFSGYTVLGCTYTMTP